ncbi:MAG: acylphosphatase [Oligoflexia bacterium]|nr:acylphosphatase [Oligoflexia bacterium]
MNTIEEWHFLISGRVQGVGFRYGVLRFVNNNLNTVTGYVRNCSDGRVEVLAQGDQTELQKLYEYCLHGPQLARVDEISMEKDKATTLLSDFVIR